MRVCVDPIGLFSPAMVRIARALQRHKPADVEIVRNPQNADMIVLYAIGSDYIKMAREILDNRQTYVVVQCCLGSSDAARRERWHEMWQQSRLVWSYYDLRETAEEVGFKFYHSALGADPCFGGREHRDTAMVMTSGHVNGPRCEAIEVVWSAARRCGLNVIHTGTVDVVDANRHRFANVHCVGKVSDFILSDYYHHARWVAALRHIEGFEMPAVEGLVSGACPILFEQPATRHWYGDMAHYVTDTVNYEDLEQQLVKLFDTIPTITQETRDRAANEFSWERIVGQFWSMVSEETR